MNEEVNVNPQVAEAVITDAEVRSFVKEILPKNEYLGTTPKLLLFAVGQIVILIGGFLLCAVYPTILGVMLAGLIVGHSMYSLGNLCHHLSHRAIFKGKQTTYFFELILWSFAITPPTIWNKTHTYLHHRHTNGSLDTFRYFSKDEQNVARTRVHKYMTPSKKNWYFPLYLLSYLAYFSLYTYEALLGRSGRSSSLVAYLPNYTKVERFKIAGENLLIIAVYALIYHLINVELWVFLSVLLLGACIASAINSFYVFSQHSLYPLSNVNHSLHNTTTMVLPSWIDKLHLNSSYHIEHHLFPAMSPLFYPKVSKMLQEKYGDKYDRRPWNVVWANILEKEAFKVDIMNTKNI